jgi:putative ABC transport system substrate-binding protein
VIGFLYAGSLAAYSDSVEAFWQGLGEFGYSNGRNVRIEFREAHNDVSRLSDLAQDLVGRGVSVIVAPGSGPAALAAKAATSTIPIVFSNAGNPVRAGLVASLNRPGGNVTGVSDFGNELSAKRLELIKMLVPIASRIGVVVTRNYAAVELELENARKDTSALSIEPIVWVVSDQREIDAAFEAFAQEGFGGVYVGPGPLVVNQRAHVVEVAARYRLPTIYPFIQFPQIGGLMSYGTSLWERNYQAGVYTGRILDGADPADLPVHRLSRFEFVINMTTARALGLTVPDRLLAITDRVVE